VAAKRPNAKRKRPGLRAQNKDPRKRRGRAASAKSSKPRAAATKTRHAHEMDVERGLRHTAEHDTYEIRHRLKNMLAVIQAIANATLVDGVPLAEARTAFNTRLGALAKAHDILFNAGWTRADLAVIIREVLAPYRGVRSKGPDVALGPKPALAFALALHELGTNASKYGALSVDGGYVDIAWKLARTSAGDELRLRWRERHGPRVRPPTHEGFGSRLIRDNLASEFSGTVELEFQPDGVACTVCAPAKRLH